MHGYAEFDWHPVFQTASTYERTIPFTIRNDGSATFFFDWHYTSSFVKKYLQLSVEPKSGHVTPATEVECTLFFNLKKVPVQAFPVTLSVSYFFQFRSLTYLLFRNY